MRWEELFADLEAEAEDARLLARDDEAAELGRGEWSVASWVELAADRVDLVLASGVRLGGAVRFVGQELMVIDEGKADVVIARSRVTGLRLGGAARLRRVTVTPWGWTHIWRMWQRDEDPVTVTRVDGSVLHGRVDQVGGDFALLAGPGGRREAVPYGALESVRSPR